jgi:hypothetical protein
MRRILAVAIVQPHQLVAMNAVERQDDHHHEVRHQQRDIERVPAIDVAEGVVGVVRFDVVPEAFVGGKEQRKRVELADQRDLRGVRGCGFDFTRGAMR